MIVMKNVFYHNKNKEFIHRHFTVETDFISSMNHEHVYFLEDLSGMFLLRWKMNWKIDGKSNY